MKIMECLAQYRMKKIVFNDIKYKKINNISDYLEFRNDIENCFIDDKGIDFDKLNKYKIEIGNEIEKLERKKEMRTSYAFPICIILPSVIIGLWKPEFSICSIIEKGLFIFLYGLLVCGINEYFIVKKERDILVFYNTINEILLYISENTEILVNKGM